MPTLTPHPVSDEHGLQHAMLTADTLHVAFAEAPGVTTFRATTDRVYESAGEPQRQIHVSWAHEVLTWAGTGGRTTSPSSSGHEPSVVVRTAETESAPLFGIRPVRLSR